MVIKELSLVALCLSLAGCGYRGTWDFPYPKPGRKEPTVEEKANSVVNYLEKNNHRLSFNSGKILIEIVNHEDILEAAATYTSKELEENTEQLYVRMVLWGDQQPYGSPDLAIVENGMNVQGLNPNTTCLLDMQEMTVDAAFEIIHGREHQLKPNQPFYRYFRLCFNELTKF